MSPTDPTGPTGARLRVLYFEGCPGGEVSGRILREAVSGISPGTEVEVAELPLEEFRRLGTPGSPTILIDGRDLFPVENPRGELSAGLSRCRVYATPEGLKSHPTREMVEEALGRALGMKPLP